MFLLTLKDIKYLYNLKVPTNTVSGKTLSNNLALYGGLLKLLFARNKLTKSGKRREQFIYLGIVPNWGADGADRNLDARPTCNATVSANKLICSIDNVSP